jgi:hypothetical protein
MTPNRPIDERKPNNFNDNATGLHANVRDNPSRPRLSAMTPERERMA